MEKKNELSWLFVVFIVVLLGVIFFCAYKLGEAGRKTIDDENAPIGGDTTVPLDAEEDTKDDDTSSDVKKVIINYEIKENEGEWGENKIIVNGIDTNIITYFKPTVYTMDDALIIAAGFADSKVLYVVDAKGKIVNQFVTKSVNPKNDRTTLSEKTVPILGYMIIKDPILNDKTFTIVTEFYAQDVDYIACRLDENYIVEYTYTTDYLGNGEFSVPQIKKTITSKEYRLLYDITC